MTKTKKYIALKKRVFVTSVGYNGNLGGLSGGDSKCQARANAAGLDGTWTAWLSSSSVHAKDRIPDQAYYLVDKTTKVCNNKADLIDGSIQTTISINEFGASQGNVFIWTGTNANGTAHTETCSSWTSAGSSVYGRYGWNIYTDGLWTNRGKGACSSAYKLYCFEQ